MTAPAQSRTAGLLHQAVAYAVATVVAVAAGVLATDVIPGMHLLVYVGLADIVGTIAIFIFSVMHDNSSFYDPYWSVAPIVIVAAYLFIASQPPTAAVVLALLVIAWGVRLTYNFLSGWRGLDHEDWRYRDFREQFPRAYWLVSFAGIHFFPTVLVFLGCFGIYAAFFGSSEPILALQLVGGVVTLGAIAIETIADRQLRRFVDSSPPAGAIMDEGLWRYSRHPNYFGELAFWWGVWIFGVGTSPADWLWTLTGPVAMTLLFVFVSIPLLDKRSLRRREGYADHMKTVSSLVPLPRRR